MEEALAMRDAKIVQSAVRQLPELTGALIGARAIKSDHSCKKFELWWDYYVAYLVTEEMVGSCGNFDDEGFTGQSFRVYAQSHFLAHLSRDTGGHAGKPIRHYKLICLNHLIDVASYDPPHIRLVSEGPGNPEPDKKPN